jgi:hypothetical protein
MGQAMLAWGEQIGSGQLAPKHKAGASSDKVFGYGGTALAGARDSKSPATHPR